MCCWGQLPDHFHDLFHTHVLKGSIVDAWFFHGGSNPKNAALTSIRQAILRRYGPSDDVEEFARRYHAGEYGDPDDDGRISMLVFYLEFLERNPPTPTTRR